MAPISAPASNVGTAVAERPGSDDEILGITAPETPLSRRIRTMNKTKSPALRRAEEDAARKGRNTFRRNPTADPSTARAHESASRSAQDDIDRQELQLNEEKDADRDFDSPEGPELSDSPELCDIFDANPELRQAWQDAEAYRELFSSIEEARAATRKVADFDRIDALFFSQRPEDHAELARVVASLDAAAFSSLAQAMAAAGRRLPNQARKAEADPSTARDFNQGQAASRSAQDDNEKQNQRQDQMRENDSPASGVTQAQENFYHATNAAAVENVIGAIEAQVERLLPENISPSARNRVVGEIYRELDSTLRANRQLGQQMREAFRSGALDDAHQRAIVSLVTGRAKQALPAVAKRVMNEWTSTIVSTNQDRRARQRAAEGRVDISGSGGAANDGRKSMTPRDLDYKRLSDSDILNL